LDFSIPEGGRGTRHDFIRAFLWVEKALQGEDNKDEHLEERVDV
jgi:hypothetical protein